MQEDIEVIRNALLEEQCWRAAIQARDPTRKDPKLIALEEALVALDRIEDTLRELGAVVDPPRQMQLWPEHRPEPCPERSRRAVEGPSRRLL